MSKKISEEEEEEKCKVLDPTTDECLDENIQRSLRTLPSKKKFRVKKLTEVRGEYKEEWDDIGGKGKTLAEAIADEFDKNYGRGSSFLGDRIDADIEYEIEEKKKEEQRELTNEEKEEIAKQRLEIEQDDFGYYLHGDVSKKQKDLMESWGIKKVEVTDFYNDVYGRWMDSDDIQNVCPNCGFPLTKIDIKAGYCGNCGEGPYGTSYWHGVELQEFSKQLQLEGYSIQAIEEMLDVSGLDIYIKWKEWQAQVEGWEEDRWEKQEQAMQKKLKAILESQKSIKKAK